MTFSKIGFKMIILEPVKNLLESGPINVEAAVRLTSTLVV